MSVSHDGLAPDMILYSANPVDLPHHPFIPPQCLSKACYPDDSNLPDYPISGFNQESVFLSNYLCHFVPVPSGNEMFQLFRVGCNLFISILHLGLDDIIQQVHLS